MHMRLLRKLRRFAATVTAVLLGAGVLGAAAAVAPTPALAATGCSAAYSEPSVWNTGFTASFNVTNSGTTSITGWTVVLTYAGNPQIQPTGWNGAWSQTGETVTITNLSYNGNLAPGASATGIGANFNYSGTHTPASTVTCTPAGGSTGNTVTVTNPGSQTTTVGTAVSLAIKATDSGSGQTLAYSATGLPTGLSISSSTGVISGTPTTAQTASVTVTAKDGTSASGSATFAWTINPVNTSGAPQLHVSGNKLLDANGNTVILRGINRSGMEFSCVEGKGIFDGEVDQAAITAMKSWKVNAVRVPLNEACWNGESYVNAASAGANYINAIKNFVSLLNSNGLDVILDLHWTDGDYTGPSNQD